MKKIEFATEIRNEKLTINSQLTAMNSKKLRFKNSQFEQQYHE